MLTSRAISLCVVVALSCLACEDKVVDSPAGSSKPVPTKAGPATPADPSAKPSVPATDKPLGADPAAAVEVPIKGGGTALVEKPPEGEPPAEWFACKVDADCVVVETGCCDHCNGGSLAALNLATKDAALADPRIKESCDSAPACTEMACAPHVVACVEGECASSADPEWGK